MPSRNTIKEFGTDQYYHVFNRGVEKRDIFLDDNDYTVFIGLMKRYLSGDRNDVSHRHKQDNLSNEVELVAYCLMPNHFHLLLFQKTNDGITKFMRRLTTAYVMYFNNRYERVGALFQGRYKAAHINADDYLHHISRYIHLNPKNYLTWPYSSISYYSGKRNAPKWLRTNHVTELFSNTSEYMQFLEDYIDVKKELAIIKWQLANGTEL